LDEIFPSETVKDFFHNLLGECKSFILKDLTLFAQTSVQSGSNPREIELSGRFQATFQQAFPRRL